jgi:predicted dehydrogenase
MIRGAISGFGEVAARGHLAGWAAAPNIEIVAIHDPVAARRHQAINQIKNIRVYDNLELMLAGEKLDFVDVASPPAFHEAAVRMALEAGAHVLVEKPLCLELAALAQLRRTAARFHRVLMCVHNWKHSPAYELAYRLLRSGRIGEAHQLSFERLRPAPAGSGAVGAGDQWRLHAAGGGILIDHGWHVFYLMQWLLGGRRPQTVSAELSYRDHSAIDEVAMVNIELEGGLGASVYLSWRAPRRVTTATVHGVAGSIEVNGNHVRVRTDAGLVEDHVVDDPTEDSYHPTWFAGVAAEFAAAVAQGPDGAISSVNLAEAQSALALITAARSSAARGGQREEL